MSAKLAIYYEEGAEALARSPLRLLCGGGGRRSAITNIVSKLSLFAAVQTTNWTTVRMRVVVL